MRRWVPYIVAAALLLSLGYNVYQKVSFNRLYWYWGSTLIDRLINGRQLIDQVITETDPGRQSAGAFAMQEAPKEIQTLGSNLDVMLSRVWPFPETYLGRVGLDLNMFTVGVWNRSNTEYLPGSQMNPLPPGDELARLSRVYTIYADHFPDRVVFSQSPSRHRQALKAAHAQIRAEGLDELLPENYRDLVLDQGLN